MHSLRAVSYFLLSHSRSRACERGEQRSRKEPRWNPERRENGTHPFSSLRPNLSSFLPLISMIKFYFFTYCVSLRGKKGNHSQCNGCNSLSDINQSEVRLIVASVTMPFTTPDTFHVVPWFASRVTPVPSTGERGFSLTAACACNCAFRNFARSLGMLAASLMSASFISFTSSLISSSRGIRSIGLVCRIPVSSCT